MASAYSVVVSSESLKRAWSHVFANARKQSRNTAGVDGDTLNTFASELPQQLAALGNDLRAKTFQFSELRAHLIPKHGGKHRLICVPTVRDRVTQRALLDFLSLRYSSLLANHINYGFVQSRSVQMAAKQACDLRKQRPWALKTDITSFFDSMPRDRLRSAIRRHIRERSLDGLLDGALSCEISPTSEAKMTRIKKLGVKPGLGVRQGMPLAPFFANVLLYPLDAELVKRSVFAVRYADDLVIFANSEAACIEAFGICKTVLATLDLKLPALEDAGSKSAICAPDQVVEFLGLGLAPKDGGYVLTLMPDQLLSIRESLMAMSNVKELLARRILFPQFGPRLEARCSGYLAAYESCINHGELVNSIEDVRQSALRRLYRDGLKIDLEHASAEVRTFLGLATGS